MSIEKFIDTRERECIEVGVEPAQSLWKMTAVEKASSPVRGRLVGHFTFPGFDAYLQVHELFEFVTEERITRLEFGYFLIVEGREVWGYERDPNHDPAEHFHDGTRHQPGGMPHPAISFKEACQRGWDHLAP